jgi:hypothetical protein
VSTEEQLQAENDRLGAEVAALRVLLTAVSDLADVPMPASSDDMQVHYYECVRRIDMIAVYAGGDLGDVRPSILPGVLHDRANALREHGRRALRYTPKAVTA